MPVYEYECSACGHQFEEWQKIKDDPIKTCPKCSKDQVQRLISQTAFQLKGGGWYKDLYSSAGKSDKSGSNGKADSKSDSTSKSDSGGAGAKSEASSSAKSETKSESKSSASSTTSSSGGSGGGGTAK